MQVAKVIIDYKHADRFKLYLFGDIHMGTVHHAEEEALAQVKEIKNDPSAMWIGMGDYAECITPHDKRWDPSAKAVPDWLKQDDIANSQYKHVMELLDPIRSKCVGLIYGNHENSIRVYNHDNIHKWLCDGLGVPNLGYSCFVHFIFRRKKSTEAHLVKGMFTHGTGGARTEGGKINYLVRMMSSFEANLYGYAHTHSIQMYSPEILGTNDNFTITAKGKIGALTGCWFRTYTQGEVASYGEVKVYPPTRIGCPTFTVTPSKGTIEGETPPIMW